jgi:hypothetical protein
MDEATLNEITVLAAELIRLRTTHNNADGVPGSQASSQPDWIDIAFRSNPATGTAPPADHPGARLHRLGRLPLD